jgi:hypothetical protein
VICSGCERWNLTPFEERWEAIEECERRYRGTTLRVSTENIGLARLRDGVELVRIGKPLRPEFAAWRYAKPFLRRRRKTLATSAGVTLASGALAAVGLSSAVTLVAATPYLIFPAILAADAVAEHLRERVVARVAEGRGDIRPVRERHLNRMEFVPDGETWKLLVAHESGMLLLDGTRARQSAAQLLAAMNRQGATSDEVQDAVKEIESAGDSDRFILRSARLREARRRSAYRWDHLELGLLNLTATERIALEMASHEDAERLAMEGELSALEQAWQDAEEIAAIADSLLLPKSLLSRILSKGKG